MELEHYRMAVIALMFIGAVQPRFAFFFLGLIFTFHWFVL